VIWRDENQSQRATLNGKLLDVLVNPWVISPQFSGSLNPCAQCIFQWSLTPCWDRRFSRICRKLCPESERILIWIFSDRMYDCPYSAGSLKPTIIGKLTCMEKTRPTGFFGAWQQHWIIAPPNKRQLQLRSLLSANGIGRWATKGIMNIFLERGLFVAGMKLNEARKLLSEHQNMRTGYRTRSQGRD
jgi:hypothetical protein